MGINFALLEGLVTDDEDNDDDNDDDDYEDNYPLNSQRISHTICSRGGGG